MCCVCVCCRRTQTQSKLQMFRFQFHLVIGGMVEKPGSRKEFSFDLLNCLTRSLTVLKLQVNTTENTGIQTSEVRNTIFISLYVYNFLRDVCYV
jgi:hypothetical protein